MLSKALVEAVAVRLTHSFRFPMCAGEVEEAGYTASALVPEGLPYGFEFAITLSRSLANAEAVFRPDAFSGYLVRELDTGVREGGALWPLSLAAAADDDVEVLVIVNGSPVRFDDFPWLEDEFWRSVEIVCRHRLSRGAMATEVEGALLAAAAACLTFVLAGLDRVLVDDLAEGAGPEGRAFMASGLRYERSPANRRLCLSHHGHVCAVCGFDFGARFGPPGDEFIEVHHLQPLAEMDGPSSVNPVTDLVPLCSNCHRMAHRRRPPYTPEELRAMLRASGSA